MGNKSKFSCGHRQQQQHDYKPASSINQTGSFRDSRQAAFEQQEHQDKLTSRRRQPFEPPDRAEELAGDVSSDIQFERENPNKITHGFWLQQYTWLHNDNSLGGGCAAAAAAASDTTTVMGHKQQRAAGSPKTPSPRAPQLGSRRQRLMSRWNNLVRTFGGSQGDNLAGQDRLTVPGLAVSAGSSSRQPEQRLPKAASSAPSTAHSTLAKQPAAGASRGQQQHDGGRQFKWVSPSRWRPASSSGSSNRPSARDCPSHESDNLAEEAAGEATRKRGRWFKRPMSSSASTLVAKQRQHQLQQQPSMQLELPGPSLAPDVVDGETRSRSSCELRALDGAEATAGSPKRPNASSYKQIVKALASKSPTRRRKKQPEELEQLPAPSDQPPSQCQPHGPKRSRLMQFAFPASSVVHKEARVGQQQRQHQQSPGLLASLFVSPLFRRCEPASGSPKRSGRQQQAASRPQQELTPADDKEAKLHDCAIIACGRANKEEPLEASRVEIRPFDEIVGGGNSQAAAASTSDSGALGSSWGAENGARKREAGEDGQLQAAPRGVPAAAAGWKHSQPERAAAAVARVSELDQREEWGRMGNESLETRKPTTRDASGDGDAAKESQSASSEFKFQPGRCAENYYANETKAHDEPSDSFKCPRDDDLDEGGSRVQVDRGRPVGFIRRQEQEAEPKCLAGEQFDQDSEGKALAASKRVKVIHNDELHETRAEVLPLGQSVSKDQGDLKSNGFTCSGQDAANSSSSKNGLKRHDRFESNHSKNMEDNSNLLTGQQSSSPMGDQMEAAAEGVQLEAGNFLDDDDRKLDQEVERSLLPLIRPLASSSSSFSSICFDSTSQHAHESDNEAPTPSIFGDQQQQSPPPAVDKPSVGDKQLDLPERPASTPVVRQQQQSGQEAGTKGRQDQSEQPASSGRQKVGYAPSSGVGMLKNNFKKLVKRQQSVDSYRMARDLKNKLKRQHEVRNKHQSNEAIKTKSVSDDQQPADTAAGSGRRKFSMLDSAGIGPSQGADSAELEPGRGVKLRICIDPYAKPGSFTLPGEDRMAQEESSYQPARPHPARAPQDAREGALNSLRANPTPPNTLSLMAQQPGAFIVGSFSGCITPTYPTYHLPSPKYGSPPASKKYSNASTVSSSIGAESQLNHSHGATNTAGTSIVSPNQSYFQLRGVSGADLNQQQVASGADGSAAATGSATNPSDTESSLGGPTTPSRAPTTAAANAKGLCSLAVNHSGELVPTSGQASSQQSSRAGSGGGVANATGSLLVSEQAAAAAAARRAQLAEHIYDNKCGLGEDMKFLASLPELCDITFLVGETREPVCAVKSVLAARSRVFHKILFGNRGRRMMARQQRQDELEFQTAPSNANVPPEMDRRSSSPRPQTVGAPKSALAAKSSSPISVRNTTPNQQQQQWSVMADASGYNPTGSPSVSPVQSASAGGDESQSRSGRVSVTSNGGRDSGISHTSQGSQQPLIIGPGQTAAPAPASSKRNKKSSARDGGGGHHGGSRLSRMFMKRASDPSIKQQHNQLNSANHTTQSYLDKMSSSQMSTTMIIEEFEPDVFRQLIEYIHTGCVLLQARTLLGLLNAADYYGLEQLRKACLRFVSCCITVDTVCSLLSTAERYIQYKCTKSIVQKVLEFVDTHADEIFKLNAFGLLPEHVVRLILSRDGLKADEHVKYNGVYTWCEHYCRSYELTNISDVMRNFIDLIQFHKIPTNVLLSEIYPTHIVPDNIFLSALAYQADPLNFEPKPLQTRRVTLPNPSFFKPFGDDGSAGAGEDNDDDDEAMLSPNTIKGQSSDQENEMLSGAQAKTSLIAAGNSNRKRKSGSGPQQRPSKDQPAGVGRTEPLYGSQQTLAKGAVRSRKSTGGQPDNGVAESAKSSKLRKGSIAQVSISGVMRLSHKLSIKKRSSNIVGGGSGSGTAQSRRRIGSIASSSNILPLSMGGKKRSVSKQQSAIDGGQDPMQVGQQILSAYLEQQRQRELELEERKRREELERLAAEEAKRRSEQGETGSALPGNQEAQQQQQPESHHKQPIVKSSSTRKSFKDFRHISRRIFMRHSSSKMLQQQHSSASSTAAAATTTTTTTTATTSPMVAAAITTGQQPGLAEKDKDRDKAKSGKRRNMLKIKRSETVFETTDTSAAFRSAT